MSPAASRHKFFIYTHWWDDFQPPLLLVHCGGRGHERPNPPRPLLRLPPRPPCPAAGAGGGGAL